MVVGPLEVLEKFRVGWVAGSGYLAQDRVIWGGGVDFSIIVSLQSSLGLSTVDF